MLRVVDPKAYYCLGVGVLPHRSYLTGIEHGLRFKEYVVPFANVRVSQGLGCAGLCGVGVALGLDSPGLGAD